MLSSNMYSNRVDYFINKSDKENIIWQLVKNAINP